MKFNFLLYGNQESGHSYKVRLMLLLAGIAHDYQVVDLNLPREQRAAAFRAVAKFGEVPVLEYALNDGRAFLLGAHISVADISLCGYLYWADQVQLNLPPNIRKGLDRISRQPHWRHPSDCMQATAT